jgi:hypothetical protein
MRYTLFFLLFILLTGCVKDRIKIGSESIQNLSTNYKCTGILDELNSYHYLESTLNKSGLEIQLWNKGKQFREGSRIIVFVFKNKGYAIPLLTNEYKKYWNFQIDNNQSDTSKLNTTFEKELSNMIERLNLKDSVKMTSGSLGSLFLSLMQCRLVYESDINEIINESLNCVDSTSDSKTIETKHLSEIINSMTSKMKEGKKFAHFNAAWDEIDHRIYQLNLDSLDSSKKFHPCLSVYRLDWDCRPHEKE